MSRDFRGKNNLPKASQLFYTRAQYQIQAHPENDGDGGKHVKDLLFFERIYYGMIDGRDNPVIPNEDFLAPLPTAGNGNTARAPRAMDFVVRAFADLKNLFDRACQSQQITMRNPIFAPFTPVRAYTSPKKDYETHLKKVLTAYNTEVLPNLYDMKNIITFDDYVKTFVDYLSKNPLDHIITLSKWCRSGQSSVFHSGLAIDIAGLPFDIDQDKIDSIIDSPVYPFYANAALNTGFSIMKNAPGVLVADLQSPLITKYVSNAYNKIKTINDLFDSRYINSLYIERNILRILLFRYFNFFVSQNILSKTLSVCNGKTLQTYKRRVPITIDQLSNLYPEAYWIDFQIDIKNIEDRVGFSQGKVANIKKEAKNLSKTLDNNAASGYILKEFGNQTWNKPYGYGDLLKHQENLEKSEQTQAQNAIIANIGGSSGGTSSGGGGSSY